MWEGGKCRSFRMCLNLKDYQFKTSRFRCQVQVNIYEPHGNHKSKTYNRYTKAKKKIHRNTIREKSSNQREETKRKRTEKNYKNKQKSSEKMAISTHLSIIT